MHKLVLVFGILILGTFPVYCTPVEEPKPIELQISDLSTLPYNTRGDLIEIKNEERELLTVQNDLRTVEIGLTNTIKAILILLSLLLTTFIIWILRMAQ